MKQCRHGYYIETRTSNDGKVGINENCKFWKTIDGNRQADLLFAITNKGEIVHPYYLDKVSGFIPIEEKIELTNEGIEKYMKSHKPITIPLDKLFAIVELNAYYDKETHEVYKKNNKFYVPKGIIKQLDGVVDNKGNYVPCLLTQLCSNTDSYLTKKVNSNIITMYENKIFEFLTYDIIENRKTYMRARLGV